MGVTYAGPTEISSAIAPFAAEPARAAAFFDLDGTLAPIVSRPDAAAVPSRTRELVERIGERYGLAGVVSGRRAADARGILGLEGLTYIGNHGYEVLDPGADAARPAPALDGKEHLATDFLAALEPGRLEDAALRIEDKGAIIALHWRGATDEGGAEAVAAAVAAEAEAAGLHTHRGRMVVELRPPVQIDKGIGLRALLDVNQMIGSVFYAGDDRTDADAFRVLGEMAESRQLDLAVRVAVVSKETPPEVAERADLAVAGPEGFITVLEALA